MHAIAATITKPSETAYGRFAEAAARFPDRAAVVGRGMRLSYSELAALARRCAASIAERAESGPAAVCAEVRPELFAVLLGVLATGRAYLYLEPNDPPARLAALVEQAGAALVIADESMRQCVSKVPVVTLSAVLGGGGQAPSQVRRSAGDVRPGDPCVLVQTSGSTCRPQGVSISHRSLLHNIDNYRRALGISSDDRLSLLASPKFTAANSALYGALWSGACLCPYSLQGGGLQGLVEWLREERITILHTTPSLFRLLARHTPGGGFPHLRAIKLGGEPAYPSDAALFRATFSPPCVLVNGLGISEAGGNVCHYVVRQDTVLPGEATLPVGHPLPGFEVTIAGEDADPALPGHEGEIIVHSSHLAQVGWGPPSAACPEDRQHGLAEFRTGDRGKVLTGGELVHLGRMDRVAKVRGFRVDLNAIEAALLRLPTVKNAAVLLDPRPGGPLSVCGHVEATCQEQGDASALRRQLAQTLPDYMLPDRMVFHERLPLTPNGKVDRQRLLTKAMEMPVPTPMAMPPRTELEEGVAKVWRHILGAEPIGVHDDFFQSGGDSLRALELLLCLSQELGQDLPLELLLNHPTVAQMAEALSLGWVGRRPPLRWRRCQASVLALHGAGDKAPLVFLPGGYASENELMVCAGLIPYLDSARPVWGVRLNLAARGILPPWSMAAVARRAAKAIAARLGGPLPVLVGECHACGLALETARRLARRAKVWPKVILLDPWHPRPAASKRRRIDSPPAAVQRYYRLLQNGRPCRYDGEAHLVCAETPARAEACLDYWKPYLRGGCRLHVVPGDHQSYIRGHRQSLASTINAICTETLAEGDAPCSENSRTAA